MQPSPVKTTSWTCLYSPATPSFAFSLAAHHYQLYQSVIGPNLTFHCQRNDLPIWVYGSPRAMTRLLSIRDNICLDHEHIFKLGETAKMRLKDEGEGLGTMSLECILQRLEDGRFTSELLVKVKTRRVRCHWKVIC